MVSATRTLDPLHFEDLTRQLVYGFKNWRRLEATVDVAFSVSFRANTSHLKDNVQPERNFGCWPESVPR